MVKPVHMLAMVIIMLCVCVALPLYYAWRIVRLEAPSGAVWLLAVAEAGVIVALVLLVGRWDMAGYYTRFLLLAIFLASVFASLARLVCRRPPLAGKGLRGYRSTLVSLLLLGATLGYAVSGTLPPRATRDVEFPLVAGRFMIGQGGRVGLLNHHAGHAGQRFAADITAIGRLGFRADGLAPEELERYAVYGATVVSPCTGEVAAMRDDLVDLVPPNRDRENPRGNHVIVDCGGFNVELAHLQAGSVAVETGERVSAGETVGKVGNSGNTTEPHLHVHAVDPQSGTAIPLSFGGRWPVRNRVYTAPGARAAGLRSRELTSFPSG